jgi:hypothetical protein
MDYQQIRDLIANARKRTPVTVYVRHDDGLTIEASEDIKVFPTGAGTTIIIGEWDVVSKVLTAEASRNRRSLTCRCWGIRRRAEAFPAKPRPSGSKTSSSGPAGATILIHQ